MGPLMGVQPDSGSTDPGAAVSEPDSDMTAGLHTVLAGCTLAFTQTDRQTETASNTKMPVYSMVELYTVLYATHVLQAAMVCLQT